MNCSNCPRSDKDLLVVDNSTEWQRCTRCSRIYCIYCTMKGVCIKCLASQMPNICAGCGEYKKDHKECEKCGHTFCSEVSKNRCDECAKTKCMYCIDICARCKKCVFCEKYDKSGCQLCEDNSIILCEKCWYEDTDFHCKSCGNICCDRCVSPDKKTCKNCYHMEEYEKRYEKENNKNACDKKPSIKFYNSHEKNICTLCARLTKGYVPCVSCESKWSMCTECQKRSTYIFDFLCRNCEHLGGFECDEKLCEKCEKSFSVDMRGGGRCRCEENICFNCLKCTKVSCISSHCKFCCPCINNMKLKNEACSECESETTNRVICERCEKTNIVLCEKCEYDREDKYCRNCSPEKTCEEEYEEIVLVQKH